MKIKSIKKIKNDSKKYDLQIKNNANYFANGILVHNCSMYKNYTHARSVDSKNHPSRNWLKNFHSNISQDIPDGWRICGENMYAKHSIKYDDLKSFFYGFSIWNEKNICLSWDEILEYFQLLNIEPVPILYDGLYNEKIIKKLYDSKKDWDKHEGYVIRIADEISYKDFKSKVAKFVRKNHILTTKHWQSGQIIEKNKLKIK